MAKIVEVSNDIESGFYLDGELLCQCESSDVEAVLRALGYDYKWEENWEVENFPESLDKALKGYE